jgi:hypothetical protein
MEKRSLETMLEGMRQAEMLASGYTDPATLPFFALAQRIAWTVAESDQAESIWHAVQPWIEASLKAGTVTDEQLLAYPVWIFPVGVLFKGDTASLRQLMMEIMRYADGDAMTSAFAFAAALNARLAGEGVPASAWIAALHQELGDVFELNLLRIGHVLAWGSEQHAIRHLSQPAGKGTIPAQAICAILRHHADSDEMLRQSLMVREQPYLVALWCGIMALT